MNRRDLFKTLAGAMAGAGAAKMVPVTSTVVLIDGHKLADVAIPKLKRERILGITDLRSSETYYVDTNTRKFIKT